MDRDTALRRIKKCLDLSRSPEPLEAARALAQAQKLMAKFDIDHPELLASGVVEGVGPSRAKKKPPYYEVTLAQVVADSFGCNMIFSHGHSWTSTTGLYKFIGVGTAGEVAAYTFTVLSRKLTAARAAYTKAKLGRYTKNKVAAADLFCDGWVRAVAQSVLDAAQDDDRDAALIAYMGKTYPQLSEMTPRRRELANVGRSLDHKVHGFLEGQNAHVSTSITSRQPQTMSLAFDA